MPSLAHPDPELCPLLDWGDPIPLQWQRVEPGRWVAWPPRQFRTPAPAGSIVWRPGTGIVDAHFYSPEIEPGLVAPGTVHEVGVGWDAPVIGWGDPLPCSWRCHDDGRSRLHLASMRVSLPPGEVHFKFAYRETELYFYPSFANQVELFEGSIGDASYIGEPRYLSAMPVPGDKEWRRRAADRRWILGRLAVEPSRTRFIDAADLLPLTLPSREEIEAVENRRLSDAERGNGDVLYLRLIEDLARSDALMDRIGDDEFSAQVQCFLADNDLVRRGSDSRVIFTSDRNYGDILALLRRYGETYMMYDSHWAEADPAAQEAIGRIFEEAGYSIAG